MSQSTIQRFLFKEHAIRGQHVHLNDAWRDMITDRHYGPTIQALLGELAVIATMIANNLKHQGKITLQVQGSGPVHLLVIEVTHDLKIRGLAKTQESLNNDASFNEMLGDGQILVTLENTQTRSHFQSFVPRESDTIAGCFEDFFTQSDQQPARLWLAADAEHAGGFLLQKMPENGGHEVEVDEDAWNRTLLLAETLKEQELLTLNCETTIHRLFHEELVELFEEKTVCYECPQDKERVDAMLRSLGEEEVRKILEEEGKIAIHNEICNFHLVYLKEDVDALFATTMQ